MKQPYFLLIALLLLATNANAQKARIKFSGINQLGILKGSSDQTFQLQTINGIRYKTWFAGVGVGYENYYLKTIPLFIDIRWNLLSKKATPFIYADIGANLPSKKQKKGEWQTSDYKAGLYYDVGRGYSAPIKGNFAFKLSAGYSQKQLHEARTNIVIWDFPPYGGNDYKEYFDYTFRRLSIKAALQF